MIANERLEQYIKEDKLSQDFIDSKTSIKDLTDFDLYCIQHCTDIEEMLEKNQQLKEKFKATNKGLQKVVLKRKKWKHRYQLARCEIKELKKQLEEYKEQLKKGLYNTYLPYTTGYNKAIKDKETQQKELYNYIKNLQKENKELQQKLESEYKNYSLLQEDNERLLDKIRELKGQQKKFIKYLEDEIENSTFLKPSLKMILQKCREIVNGDDK